MKHFYQYILLSLPLIACGGSSDDSDEHVKVAPDYSALSETQLKPTPLREASADELSLLVKNGLRISLREHNDVNASLRDNALPASTGDQTEAGGNFSGTNVQVDGVDEADSVKYDGKFIYLATPVDYSGNTPSASIKIFSTDTETSSVSQVSETSIDASYWGDISELYLVNNNEQTTGLVSVRRSWGVMHMIEPMDANRASMSVLNPYQMDTGIRISLYDVQNPATLTETWSLSIDGDLLGSRKIGNMLYIVSSFVPGIDDLNYAATTRAEKIANEQLIARKRIEQILPEYSINHGTSQPLNASNSCLIPDSSLQNQGYLNLINITAINLGTQQLVDSVCINSNIQGIYASIDNLYLGASDTSNWESWDEFTVVHKFSLNEQGVDYRATGSVEGSLGWSSPSFRMDEHNDYLRVVTTRYDNATFEPTHTLQILHETDNNQLAQVTKLPNESHPESIGKPREDIYAVRFYGDKAYVVTFERIDPLYVLDLADPNAPKIAGQLELPGFSTYLHPVGENYLFSFGYETDSNGAQTGIKAGLFDISNISNPVLIGQQLFGNNRSQSEALYDHRAFSFLQTSADQLRISLPIMNYADNSREEDLWSYEMHNSLQLLEINGLENNSASLDLVGEINADSSNPEIGIWYSGNDRGIMHDNSVFYVRSPDVIGSAWPQE